MHTRLSCPHLWRGPEHMLACSEAAQSGSSCPILRASAITVHQPVPLGADVTGVAASSNIPLILA